MFDKRCGQIVGIVGAGLALLCVPLGACGGRVISTTAGTSSDGAGGSLSGVGGSLGGPSTTTRGAGGSNGATVTSVTTRSGPTSVTTATVNSSTTSIGASVEVPFADGWARRDENEYGIQGAFWTANDLGGSFIEPYFSDWSCAHGIATQVQAGPDGSPDFGYYWGAMLGFNLNQEAGADALPYDALERGVAGFGFEISGSHPFPPEGELRLSVKVVGDDSVYCTRLPNQSLVALHLSSVHQNCWENDPTTPTPDPTRLESLQWHYATNTSFSYPFDLCIAQLWVIPD